MYVMFRYNLPNTFTRIIVILAEAWLSFLGIGIKPPEGKTTNGRRENRIKNVD
jgi:ABC-type dipeptide/oligopeptide/nickel transport system permease subunit